MEKDMFNTHIVRFVLRIIGSLIAIGVISFIFYGLFSYIFGGVDISLADTYGEYVKLDADLITPSYASDQDGNEFVIVTDLGQDEYYDYIVSLPSDMYNSEEVQRKIAFSYGSETNTDTTDPVHFSGYVESAGSELMDVSQESYQILTGDENIDASDYLGNYYISYADHGNNIRMLGFWDWFEIIVMIVLLIGCVVELVRTVLHQHRLNRKINRSMELYQTDPDYSKGVEEAHDPSAVSFRDCRCCITENYVVSYQEGLEVFRIEDIRELYGYDQSRDTASAAVLFGFIFSRRLTHYLVAVTTDGEAHAFAGLTTALKSHNQITAQLLKKNQNMTLGRKSIAPSDIGQPLESPDLSRIRGFYGSDAVWAGRTGNSFIVE